jgi:hypothetical protein
MLLFLLTEKGFKRRGVQKVSALGLKCAHPNFGPDGPISKWVRFVAWSLLRKQRDRGYSLFEPLA